MLGRFEKGTLWEADWEEEEKKKKGGKPSNLESKKK